MKLLLFYNFISRHNQYFFSSWIENGSLRTWCEDKSTFFNDSLVIPILGGITQILTTFNRCITFNR
jgi:hypothetical protein